MSHQEEFKNFIGVLDTENINYVIIRGFWQLPNLPDTDIDLVVDPRDWERLLPLVHENLRTKKKIASYGYAEWCDMFYWPVFTRGPKDFNIPNKCFRIDLYNSIYFKSPLNDYTTFWTISHDFFNKIMNDKLHVNFYYTPCKEDEIALLILRNTLDMHGREWKQKHINRIKKILSITDKIHVIQSLSMAVPNAGDVYDLLEAEQYEDIIWD